MFVGAVELLVDVAQLFAGALQPSRGVFNDGNGVHCVCVACMRCARHPPPPLPPSACTSASPPPPSFFCTRDLRRSGKADALILPNSAHPCGDPVSDVQCTCPTDDCSASTSAGPQVIDQGSQGGGMIAGQWWDTPSWLSRGAPFPATETDPQGLACMRRRKWGGGGGAPRRQPLGPADAHTAHPATFSTAPAHQRRGSANAETTPAGAPAAVADRTQRPNATCKGKNG